MKIVDVICAPGFGAFYYDDQAAIRAGAELEGFRYVGAPRTPGFRTIRQPARCLSIGLCLEDGFVAWGDALTVQYAGVGGRDPVFDPDAAAVTVATVAAPRLLQRRAAGFIALADATLPRTPGERLPLALEYGVSQALLRAVAHVRRCTMAEVLCDEFGVPVVPRRVPLFAQSGDDRYVAVDKMLMKGVDVLPHGLINAPAKFGPDGDAFVDYVRWIGARIPQVAGPQAAPVIHVDLYGLASQCFGADLDAVAACLVRAERAAAPYALQIETPIDCGSTGAQLAGFKQLRARLDARGSSIKLVADEWCNTLDDVELFARERAADLVQIKMPDVGRVQDSARAVLACKRAGVGAYLGGSCAETELSGAVAAHVAVATQADMVLAKPAMDVDAAVTIVGNEQRRLVATLARAAAVERRA